MNFYVHSRCNKAKKRINMKIEDVIIVLGSTNDQSGNISDIGLQRLNKGISLLNAIKGSRVILTGGFGSHFNSTNIPYSTYAKEFLIKNNVNKNRILDCVLSTNSIEDATLTLPLIKEINPHNIHIVSSDFHMERVKYIFNNVFSGMNLSFHEVNYKTEEKELQKLRETEIKGLKLLKEIGKSIVDSEL